MPQFDIFSFFSQLFWVFLAFNYLYLALSYYILPAFAATLKVRAKKLSQLNSSTKIAINHKNVTTNTLFFDQISIKFSEIYFFRKSLTNDIIDKYEPLIFKKEAFHLFNFLKLKNLKTITLYF